MWFIIALIIVGVVVGVILENKKNKRDAEREKIDYTKSTCAKTVVNSYNRCKNRYPKDFTVIDTETTGLSPATEEIIQLSAIKYRCGEEVGRYDTYINPGKHIPIEASRINNIYDKDVKGKPFIRNVLDDFIKFIGDDVLVAHNASFDMKFIQTALNANGYQVFSNDVIDTLQLARKYINTDNHKLETLKSHLGIIATSHNSLSDCFVTGKLYLHCIEKINTKPEVKVTTTTAPDKKQDLSEFEIQCYRYLHDMLVSNGKNSDMLRYRKSQYFDILVLYTFVRIKDSSRNRYILLNRKYESSIDPSIRVSEATKSEGTDKVRVHINSASELEGIKDILLEEFDYLISEVEHYVDNTNVGASSVSEYLNNFKTITQG